MVVGVARREQPHDLRRIQAVAGQSAFDDVLDRRINRARVDRRRPRSDPRARRPIVVTRQALGIAQTAHLLGDLRRRPDREVACVGRIDGQPMHQQFVGNGRALGKLRYRRPRRLRIDVIRGDWRDPTPIIDARRNQPRIDARRQIGGCLDIHRGAQDQARGGDAPKQVVQIGLRGAGELRAGLGAEVLNDDLLNMPETAAQIADGE